MEKKRTILLIAIFLVTAATLLSLWLGGALNQESTILPSIQEKLTDKGIYARLDAEPEAGILPGDILHISLDIFFESAMFSVDENELAENYIGFREDSLRGCEEYGPPVFESKSIGSIEHITISHEFQCWFTQEKEISLNLMVGYTKKESSDASTIHLTKRVAFTSIPITASAPKPLAEHVYARSRLGIWIIGVGAILMLCSIGIYVAAQVHASGKKTAKDTPDETPGDYFSHKIAALRAMLENHDVRVISDKLYHLCLELEAARGKLDNLKPIKKSLLEAYEKDAVVKQEDIKQYLDLVQQIAKNGDDAKCL